MIIIFDRKQDFYELALDFRFLYFLLEDFMDNWCAPPDGIISRLWFNVLAEILATSFELRVAAQGMLVDILCYLGTNMAPDYPTLRDVMRRLYAVANEGKGSQREIAARLYHRLSSLISVVGDAAASKQRPDWQYLMKLDWSLSLAGLASSTQSLCITIYFAKVLLYRICNNLRTDKLETLIVLDEASMIFPKTATKKTSILLDYFQQARAFGIGVIFASQSMNLADEIFANTAIKVAVGGFGHGADYEAFGSAVGLSRGQRDFMRTISQPGSAVVKDVRHPHPFTVQIERPKE
ncbi:MAG: ATP-binding protein [Proteobacteria bacterium]|nr:ATP-binding protein [Pseudomonadota bacterium]